ncbi:hypothetical protein Pla100_18480 [Neorhodopirellula pilleata]|uniref:Uncharacterized protein n=2 Tax=Neorhodopirellula pilleata TaxID=2714738 RepID=A0A5C6ARB9_9BACT|nr:hypothetical protein Pla100_18480 [Neorhodopirellula pilleata]
MKHHKGLSAVGSPAEGSPVVRWVRQVIGVLLVLAVAGGGAAWWAWSQAHHVPEFYKRARNQSGDVGKVARTALRHDVRQAQKDAKKNFYWNASFSEEQINAWLQEELPGRFERLVVHGVSEPAIALENGQLLAAARYASSRWDMIVSCRLSVEMTEEPNLIAIALSDLKAGSLPLPLEPFVRKISKEAALGNLDVRWDFTERGPIALVTIPHDDDKYLLSPLIIESINLIAGQLELSGRAGDQASDEYSPRGPVHRFVSYRKRQETSQH